MKKITELRKKKKRKPVEKRKEKIVILTHEEAGIKLFGIGKLLYK